MDGNPGAISQFLREAASIEAKRIDVRLKLIRANIEKQIIALSYVHTSKMMDDLQVKGFPAPRCRNLREL